MAGFPIFTPPSPAPFFNLPNQPDYSGGIAAGIGGIGESFRANRKEDFLAQQAADTKAYNEAQLELTKRGQDITAMHYAADAGPGGESWGVTPIYGTDAAGKPTAFLTSNRGNIKSFVPPGGGTLTKTPLKLDMGSYFVLVDPITMQPVPGPDGRPQILQKDLAGAAVAKGVGEAAGAKQANLPAVDEAVTEMDRSIDAVLNDPALKAQIGPIEGHFPETWDMTGERQRVRGNIRKVMNNAFTIAYDKLKGAGPISEGEGRAATAAIAQLQADDIYTPDETLIKHLQEARDRVHAIAESQRKIAALTPVMPTPPPLTAPAPGSAPAATAPAAPGGTAPIPAEEFFK